MPVASITTGEISKVWEIKTLGKARDAEARQLLQSVAKQVQPIMQKRKWRVKLLSEFCSSKPFLLGLNVGGGVEVKIRLRRPNRELEFYPYEELLVTMLHELVHNEHGPHDAKFYKLLDEITKECEELMAKGISGTGQGFDTLGTRLGGVSHNPPLSSLRQSALAAAERRAQLGALVPSGPNHLGGDCEIMKALSPIQAAAMAAERRLRDDLWCAASVISDVDGVQKARETEEAVGGSAPSAIGATDRITINAKGESSFNKNGLQKQGTIQSLLTSTPRRESSSDGNILTEQEQSQNYKRKKIAQLDPWTSEAGKENSFLGTSSSKATFDGQTRSVNGDDLMWECHICTLFNPPLALVCGACGVEKSRDSREKFKFWSCKLCTLQNPVNLDKCLACDQWRYSNGPPVSLRGPNMGT